jgi:macrolide-specific efflux system membrane fusion protein
MTAADADTPHNSMKSRTRLRRLLLTAATIFGVGLVFVTMAPSVLAPFSRPQAAPELSTAELRTFPVLATASGVLQLGNGTTFLLRAWFSQNEDVLLASGQAATVSADAIPGLTLNAKVYSIEPSVAPVGGVPGYYAEIALGQSDFRLRNGQTGSVNVTIASANNVLSVPSTALFTGANNATQVDVWASGQANATTVQIGLVGNNLTQIASGLQAGDQVMLSPMGQTLPSSPSTT